MIVLMSAILPMSILGCLKKPLAGLYLGSLDVQPPSIQLSEGE